MAYFQTKNHNLDKFWRVLPWKLLVQFMAIWSILLPFGLFTSIWYILQWSFDIFFRFGKLYQEKSGNPVADTVKLS
jgi:hypothetical protein